jgi:hypothetical protein
MYRWRCRLLCGVLESDVAVPQQELPRCTKRTLLQRKPALQVRLAQRLFYVVQSKSRRQSHLALKVRRSLVQVRNTPTGNLVIHRFNSGIERCYGCFVLSQMLLKLTPLQSLSQHPLACNHRCLFLFTVVSQPLQSTNTRPIRTGYVLVRFRRLCFARD